MRDPSPYDEDDWIEENVSKSGRKEFDKLYSKIYRSLDDKFLLNSLQTKFESQNEPKHRLFRAIVDAFSPKGGADGSNSGFEATVVNPLFERGQTDAETLLAKSQANGHIHLCFVSCIVGVEDSQRIAEEINNIAEIINSPEDRDLLKEHLESKSKSIRSVQYLTLTRDKDLIDLDYEVVKIATQPDEYAIWSLVGGELPDENNQAIQHQVGAVHHSKLREIGNRGIDVTTADNDDIRYCLTSHPVFPIGEVCMRVYLRHLGEGKDNSKELREEEFHDCYRSKMELGKERPEIKDVVEDKANRLITAALEWGVLSEDAESPDDYKIMWDSKEAGDIKDMVKHKHHRNKKSEERGNIAFEKAKSGWDDPNESFDDMGFDVFPDDS